MRLATDGGIKYALVEGYPKFGVSVNEASGAQEVYRIAAADLSAFIAEVVPPMEIIDDRVIIPALRRLPGSENFVIAKLSAEPFNLTLPGDPFEQDAAAPAGTYCDDYRVTLDYETGVASDEEGDRDDASPETFLERSIRSSMEVLSIPASGLKSADTPESENLDATEAAAAEAIKSPAAQFNMLVPINEFNFRWRRVVRPHFPNIFATMGKVNATAYTWLLNAPKHTVLFMGLSASQEFQNVGSAVIARPWNLELRFAHKQISQDGNIYSWNHAFNPAPGVGKFQTIYRKGGSGSPMHDPADFNAMFLPGPAV